MSQNFNPNSGFASAVAIMAAIAHGGRRRVARVLTPAQEAERAHRAEIAAHNEAVDAKKAAKKARKGMR